MGVAKTVAQKAAPSVPRMAPQLATGFVQETLHRAIDGVGPLPPASVAAERQLTEQQGDRKKAVREVIENHVAYAGAQGFVTNIGGVAAAAFTIPANMAGLALVQTRMVAGIAHLRGYDLDDPRVRNAILTCLLGPDGVASLVKKKRLPAPPMTIATAPTHDPMLDQLVAAEVVSELLTRIAGKRVVTTVGRRVPVLGGLVGAGSDGMSTWQIGRYAAKELLPRQTV